MTTTAELRQLFIEYFAERSHKEVPSSSLVPGNDKTLLFTNAGMVQFKDVFTGDEQREYKRAVTSQRCVRAGGKHNDLENVGYTARHHTFFEMLGNFSFGDYFKKEAIEFAWEFLTQVVNLPAEKLWITVFEDDDEAEELWVEHIGVPKERVARIGAKDNFWSMGDTGPCGPCSEIFYDHGPEVTGGPPGTPEEDGDRYIEIWNLVFMQFNKDESGEMTPLPKPSVDTGMGLERLAAILQDKHNNYEIDLFDRLIHRAGALTNCSDLENKSLRVIADHIRSCAFLIVDGVLPSNEGRGYVLRRIIRRAARHAHQLGQNEPFFHALVPELVDLMGAAYPELVEHSEQVQKVLLKEEQRFAETLDKGMALLLKVIETTNGSTLDPEAVFRLYDTYGFPVDLTADVAREHNLELDLDQFDKDMEKQRERARSSGNFSSAAIAKLDVDQATRFDGYTESTTVAKVLSLIVNHQPVSSIAQDQEAIVVASVTPFYAESGGQVGDTGEIRSGESVFTVLDTQKQGDTFLHIGKMSSGTLMVDDEITLTIDAERREAIVANHSATHLMHHALREVLGDHVQQKGSLVNEQMTRFDFSHFEPVSQQQLDEIEQKVNQQIQTASATDVMHTDMESAKAAGAMALFGEKYGDEVRVVKIGNSTELCGGTHVDHSSQISLFRMGKETGVAAGVRRVIAYTRQGALEAYQQDLLSAADALDQLGSTTRQLENELADQAGKLDVEVEGIGAPDHLNADSLRSAAAALQDNFTSQGDASITTVKALCSDASASEQALIAYQKKLQKQRERLQSKLSAVAGGDLSSEAVEVNGLQVVAAVLDGADPKSLRDTVDQLKNKLSSAAVVLATSKGEKVSLCAGVTKDYMKTVKAGDLVNYVASQVGGKGGGRPDMAQAGGNQPENLAAALESVVDWVKEQTGA